MASITNPPEPLFADGQRSASSGVTHHPTRTSRQLVRFCLVGVLNTAIDVLVLNLLLWMFAIQSTPMVLLCNAVAYATGAVNSFLLNKHWTFHRGGAITATEIRRFMLATIGGIALNDFLLWTVGKALLPLMGQTTLWANASKGLAIGGTVVLSYLGMRLWVFAHRGDDHRALSPSASAITRAAIAHDQRLALSKVLAHHGVSVILPAYNEEHVITATLGDVVSTLSDWSADFEVIVVNDGSADRTATLVENLAAHEPRVRQIVHSTNQGYGAALVDGFNAATKDLTFFMDSDGQFAIRDLERLLVHIDEDDAVLGYRVLRQDSWMRRFNAWGWNALVALALGVRVRDLDCAFKLFRTEFLQSHLPQTRGALINAELLYQLSQSSATFRQVGVRHLPRQGGRATGANLQVILGALRDLWAYTRQQRSRAR